MTVRAAEQFADPDLSPSVLRRAYRRLAYLVPERVGAWIRADLEPLGVWAPVAIGAGAGIYFGLKTEPHAALAIALLLGALGVAVFAHNRHGPSGKVLVGLVLMALGFAAADWRTAQVAAPVLDRELGIRWVTGELISIEDRARMRRMVVALHGIDGVGEDDLPARARISWRGAELNAAPGDIIRLRAGLGPPPAPAAPGTFNFSRRLYFQRIGALGFAVSPPQVVGKAETGRGDMLRTQIETIRANLLHRITDAAPGQGGAIVAAIVTGARRHHAALKGCVARCGACAYAGDIRDAYGDCYGANIFHSAYWPGRD